MVTTSTPQGTSLNKTYMRGYVIYQVSPAYDALVFLLSPPAKLPTLCHLFFLPPIWRSQKHPNLDLGQSLLPLCCYFSVPRLAFSLLHTYYCVFSSSTRISSPSTVEVMSFTVTRPPAGAFLRGDVLLLTPLGYLFRSSRARKPRTHCCRLGSKGKPLKMDVWPLLSSRNPPRRRRHVLRAGRMFVIFSLVLARSW